MARQYAQIQVSIWSDEDFKALDADLQHAFFVLISQPRMNLCGVIDYIQSRIARCVQQWTTDDVERLVKGLEAERYVVVDRDTQELLIRTFIRNDGLLKMPNVAQGMASDYGEVMSDKLRLEVEKELKKVFRKDPELGGWRGIKKGNPVLFERITKGQK
jgi:hypothetical protein